MRSPNRTPGRTVPVDLIVLHYTAGGPAAGTAGWLCDARSRVSAHYVVGHGGEVYQLVGEDDEAWHAGRSSWRGVAGVNGRSIGIEQANWGLLLFRQGAWRTWQKAGSRNAGDWWGRYEGPAPVEAPLPADFVVPGLAGGYDRVGWEPWPEELLAATERLVEGIATRWSIPGNQVVGHSNVAPGRKVDPGPVYPIARMRAAADRGASLHRAP